jgi:hypothetical protein
MREQQLETLTAAEWEEYRDEQADDREAMWRAFDVLPLPSRPQDVLNPDSEGDFPF